MSSSLKSVIFQGAYWITTAFFAIMSLPLLVVPNRKPLMLWILGYTRTMCFWMCWIGGIKITVRGRDLIPEGPCIIAAKHQSWGDGFVMFSQFFDLAFVTGDHLEKFPLVGGILRKMGAIIVDNCGGAYARAKLVDEEMIKAKNQNRRILIYPEGHLSAVGKHHRYRRGVYHMYASYDCPAVPVATNLGLFWPQQDWHLTPGEAVIEFLDPIPPGMEKDAFMKHLEHVIEQRSLALLDENGPVSQSAVTKAPLNASRDDPVSKQAP